MRVERVQIFSLHPIEDILRYIMELQFFFDTDVQQTTDNTAAVVSTLAVYERQSGRPAGNPRGPQADKKTQQRKAPNEAYHVTRDTRRGASPSTMPRGSGNYVSLPDSNADEHYENDINSNRTASAAAVAVAVPSTAAAAAGAGQNAPRGGAARAAPESSISGASAEARSTNPNFSSASDSRGGPGPASSRGDGNTKSAQQVEDEATPLNPNEDSPAGRAAAAAAAAAAAGTEKAGANSKSNAVIDPTGGLPTAEGVFVGSPIAQTSYSQAPTVSGAWASGAHSGAGIVAGPPSYNAHVASATGGGAGRSAVVVMPGGAQVGGVGVGPGGENRTVILVNTMNTPRFFEWGRQPQPFTCQSCSFSGFSSTTSDPCSNLPVLASACCCLIGLWPCSFIPFLIPDLRDMVHRCPNCCVVLGRSRHFR